MGVVTSFTLNNDGGTPNLNRIDEVFLQTPEPATLLLLGSGLLGLILWRKKIRSVRTTSGTDQFQSIGRSRHRFGFQGVPASDKVSTPLVWTPGS
jgi:hypothetical protein